MAELTIAEVARIAEGEVERGDPARTVRGVAPLDEARPHRPLVRCRSPLPSLHSGVAAPGPCSSRAARRVELPEGMAAIRVDDPRRALARILPRALPGGRAGARHPSHGRGGRGRGGRGVRLRRRVRGRGGGDARGGAGAHRRARGDRARVRGRRGRGPASPRHAVRRRDGGGAARIVHSGARLGSDGFGFVPEGAGLKKVPQVGGCVIGDDVEIGANTTIDRGSIGDTVMGRGTKIDNLVQIGHNCRIGRSVIIVSQVGISREHEGGRRRRAGRPGRGAGAHRDRRRRPGGRAGGRDGQRPRGGDGERLPRAPAPRGHARPGGRVRPAEAGGAPEGAGEGGAGPGRGGRPGRFACRRTERRSDAERHRCRRRHHARTPSPAPARCRGWGCTRARRCACASFPRPSTRGSSSAARTCRARRTSPRSSPTWWGRTWAPPSAMGT